MDGRTNPLGALLPGPRELAGADSIPAIEGAGDGNIPIPITQAEADEAPADGGGTDASTLRRGTNNPPGATATAVVATPSATEIPQVLPPSGMKQRHCSHPHSTELDVVNELEDDDSDYSDNDVEICRLLPTLQEKHSHQLSTQKCSSGKKLGRKHGMAAVVFVLVYFACIGIQKGGRQLKDENVKEALQHNNITYGHIHMAKTGGTSVNGMLALNYERVCGHKGYSYDYVQANKRFNDTKGGWSSVHDSLTQKKGTNRGLVMNSIMDEIGYEDCDWISHEGPASRWDKFRSWHQTFELHLPCREPIDHLMSQCNYKKKLFDCNTPNLDSEINECMVYMNRFELSLADGSIQLKCYDFQLQFSKYMNHMGGLLQPKKLVHEYVPRSTNAIRNKSSECIWGASDELKENVTTYLVKKYDYYSFCGSCIGSERDLFTE